MRRNLSPVVRRELANLDKDPDSRKSAMKALKSYMKDLDSRAIPLFLAQVSETKEVGSLSGEYTISLYEVLARVHGVNIVSQIDSIMATIIKTLASSAGSFPLQQACSKVVPAIARYGIDPTIPDDKKRHVIHSLCRPLTDALFSSQECLASGAALCLKALVDSDNWRYASDEMVNRVCQNAAVALDDKSVQTNLHMGLVMSLAKHNALIVEAYARLLIQSGLRILNVGVAEANSQKRLSAIQMINFLMKCLDARSIFSELDLIIEEMEKCQSDQMAYVSGAAFEALQTAKKIYNAECSKLDKSPVSVTGSNFGMRGCKPMKHANSVNGLSPLSMSPESQTLGSFAGNDSFVESPPSFNNGYDCRSVNRRLWSYGNGGVDISLKDGLFPGLGIGRSSPSAFMDDSGHHKFDATEDDAREFPRFLHRSPGERPYRSATPSPQRTHSHLVDNASIFTTPRKLICSLQDLNDFDSDYSDKQSRRWLSPCSVKYGCSPTTKSNQNGYEQDNNYDTEENGNLQTNHEQTQDVSESISSTTDIPDDNVEQMSPDMSPENKVDAQKPAGKKGHRKTCYSMLVGLLFALFGVISSLGLFDSWDAQHHLVPT